MKRIAIVGCRPAESGSTGWDWWVARLADVDAFVADLPLDVVVVSGGARGVDARAVRMARIRRIEVVEHLPDYATHGRAAPLVRNSAIVADCDEVHAWPAAWSRGTWDTVRKARAAGKPVVVHGAGEGRT